MQDLSILFFEVVEVLQGERGHQPSAEVEEEEEQVEHFVLEEVVVQVYAFLEGVAVRAMALMQLEVGEEVVVPPELEACLEAKELLEHCYSVR